MSPIAEIESILDEYHDQEWDLWYLGPCDEIVGITRNFSEKQWDEFVEFTKRPKPDNWRVMLAHSFVEHQHAKSNSLVAFQVVKCLGYFESYCALQYMRNLNGVPAWIKGVLIEKINSMLAEAPDKDRVLLENMRSHCETDM